MELFIDGMAHYDTDRIALKWTTQAEGTPAATFEIAAEGRFANCLKRTISNGTNFSGADNYLSVTPLMTQSGPWTPTASGVCGFAVKVNDLALVDASAGQSTGNNDLFAIYEGSGPVGHVALNPDGTFAVYYHQESALGTGYLGSSIQGLRSNVWSYVEFKWTIDAVNGSFEIRVNGVRVFSYTGYFAGTSVAHAYSGVWTTIRILATPGSTGQIVRACDFYLLDQEGSGDDLRDFLGDITIYYIKPEGIGNSSQFTPLSGDNWENVDEVPPDDDTTYVTASGMSVRDTYVMSDLPAGTVPLGFQTLIYAKKAAEGASSLQPIFRISGVDYDSNVQGVSETSRYRYLIQPYDTNPASGLRATEAELDACEAGQNKAV